MNKNEDSDEAIVTAIRNGDGEAYAEIIARYETKLRRYARRFLNTDQEIDDLVQDVFIKAYTNLRSFDLERRFSPWIYQIAHNTFVNELRRKSRYQFHFVDIDTILPQLTSNDTADRVALEMEVGEQLESYLTQLPPKYREIILLFYFESLSYQEISQVLEIPVNTVGVRMNRARSRLRELYKSEDTNN